MPKSEEGMMPITHPDPGVTGISLGGVFYEFKGRKVEVPIEYCMPGGPVVSHKFVPWEEDVELKGTPAMPPPQQNIEGGNYRLSLFPPTGGHPLETQEVEPVPAPVGPPPKPEDEPAEEPVKEPEPEESPPPRPAAERHVERHVERHTESTRRGGQHD